MSRSGEYWRKRTELVEDTLHNKGVEYYQTLHEQYRAAARKTEQEVSVLYSRLAKNNGISMTEAKRLLTTRELEEFRWNVDQYIKYGRENAINGQWMKQLENASLRYRISRLEAMKVQMQHHAECLFASEADGMTKMLEEMYTEGYYRTAHMIETGFGVRHSFAKLDKNRIDKVIGKPWAPDGKNFSQRIWGQHRPQLVNDLHNGLTQAIIRGDAPDELIEDISKKYNVAASKAGNLVMTESAYFGNASQQDCYAELGVEEQQFCATLDTRTSELCRSMDHKIVKSEDIVIGTNAPPLHCRCRSVMVPYFDDMEGETRIARDADGKTIHVPGDMTYDEWHDKYIKGTAADKPKRKKKAGAAGDKPAPLKQRVEEIKQDLTGHETHLSTQKTTLQDKHTELKATKDDVQNLTVEQMDLELDRDKFNRLKDVDFDTELTELGKDAADWEEKIKALEADHDRYFDRPKRGTPEYESWKKWRDGVDYETLFNDLTDAQSHLTATKSQMQLMRDRQKFVQGIDIDDLNQRISDMDDKLLNKRNKVASIEGDINHLNADIANTRLTIEDTYKRAGKEFISELEGKTFITDETVDELRAQRDKVWKDYIRASDQSKKLDLYDKYQKLNDECKELLKRKPIQNAETIKGVVEQVRSVGATDTAELLKGHLKNTRSVLRDAVMDAYSHYPTEWIDASAAASTLTLKKVSRGYYKHSTGTLAISGSEHHSQFRTALHELGHRFERAVDDLLEVEKTFYDRRTKGESLQWLGMGYGYNEKARFDDFIEKYMGKDYRGTAYEIVSMGFEYGYTEPLTLLKDPDMAELIYGLLLLK